VRKKKKKATKLRMKKEKSNLLYSYLNLALAKALARGYLSRPSGVEPWDFEATEALYLVHCNRAGIPFLEVTQSGGEACLQFDGQNCGPRFGVDRTRFLALVQQCGLHGWAAEQCAFVSFRPERTEEVVSGLKGCLTPVSEVECEWMWQG
jgi:hypothetical protein